MERTHFVIFVPLVWLIFIGGAGRRLHGSDPDVIRFICGLLDFHHYEREVVIE